MASQTFLNVNIYKPSSGNSEATNHVVLKEDVKGWDLVKLRQELRSRGALQDARLTAGFCTPAGGVIPDTTLFEDYQAILSKPKDEENKEKDDRKDKDDMKKETISHDVYLREKESREQTALSEEIKGFLSKELNLDLKENVPKLLEAKVKTLSSSYDHSNYQATAGSGKITNPANMSEEDWLVVLRHTSFLSGHRMVFGKGQKGATTFRRIERAPYQAFEIMERKYQPLAVSTNRNVSATFNFKIPRFVVADDSYVEVFETSSEVSESMARSSFSKSDIQASAGGGAFGYSAAVSAGFSKSESNAVSSASVGGSKVINITYNFPRVVLHLDSENVMLSEELMNEVEKVKREQTPEALIALHHKFGHFFPTRIELGGRLYSSEEMSTFGTATEAEAASAMKASATASFSGTNVQASASYTKDQQEASASSSKISQLQRSITWQAQGGDTLLCNNPAAWCSTVGGFDSWRVIKQDDVLPIGEFISTFKGYENTATVFSSIAEGTRTTKKAYFRLRVEHLRQPGKFLTMTMDKGKIGESIRSEALVNKEFHGTTNEDQLRQAQDNAIKYVTDTAEYKHLKHRTQNFKVSALVGELSDDAVFEVEVETYLDQSAEMRYGDIYKIAHYKSGRFIAAGDGIPNNNSTMYLYPEEKALATPFLIKRAGAIDSTDIIKANDKVELRVLDKRNNFKGFAAFAHHETVCARPWNDRWMHDVLFFRFERVQYENLVH